MTFETILTFISLYWPWLAVTALLSVLLTALYYHHALRGRERQILVYRHELDKQAQLFQQERDHHRERLEELQQARQQLSEKFEHLSKQALQDNNRHFLDLAAHFFQNARQQSNADLEKRQEAIQQTMLPVREALLKLETHTRQQAMEQTGAYHQLKEQIRALTGLQQTVQQETGRLVEAIRKPTVRGRWGEMTLRRVLESAGMMANSDFIEQAATEDGDGRQSRPDVVVRLPEGRTLVIDAKTPFDAYLTALHADNDEQRKAAMQHHARQVRQHIKSLGSKTYWDKLQSSPEFVILFIPGESMFSAALEADPSLLDDSWQHRVVLATPTSLVATMMAVAYSWKQEAMARNAEETVAHGRDLYDRLCTFVEHLQKTGRGIQQAVSSYNQAVASLESRVLPKARRFEDMGVTSSGKVVPSLAQVDVLPRSIAAQAEKEGVPVTQDAA